MTFTGKSYRDIAESILSEITRGVVEERFVYERDGGQFMLSYPEEYSELRVEGNVDGYPVEFTRGVDYLVSDHHLAWSKGHKPDRNTEFVVYHTTPPTTDISDINPGSVIRTIVESIAMEMSYLYARMDGVYASGFVDSATGEALDLIVAMLGIARKPAGFAIGEVTMGSDSEPGIMEVPEETLVYDGKEEYTLKNVLVSGIRSLKGLSNGDEIAFVEGTDYSLRDDTIVWIAAGGKRPDLNSIFYVSYGYYEQIVVPKDSEVSTYSRNPENVRSFKTARDTVLLPVEGGKWEADIPVIATAPGKDGNVYAGRVTVMPSPIPGINYVINKTDIGGGTDVESDDELRNRGLRAMERAGKATLRALKLAVQAVEGVSGEVIVIDQPDGVPGLIQVIASGGDREEIEWAIEETRSAGIKVEFKRPVTLSLDLNVTIVLAPGADQEGTRQAVDTAIMDYMGTLEIGDDVIVSRIIEAAVGVEGVKDAREVVINGKPDNVVVKETEKGACRVLEIVVRE
ncbi:MAG TPA: baseplate J/gp47 family protein [Methanocella sp.]|jgi:uncharacterized phage protein gp47/JayE